MFPMLFLLLQCCWLVVGKSAHHSDTLLFRPRDPLQATKKAFDDYEVHVVFMNHLDVGYDGISPVVGFVNNVLNKYFTEYFPRAATLHQNLTKGGYVETFKYTTHAWLVTMYTNCPTNFYLAGVKLQCPSAKELAVFKKAVQDGAITWHAGPMNMQFENQEQWLLDYSLKLAPLLDQQFNVKRPTRVLSQRDVPGMTRAVIPTLVKHGISAISVGVNPMTSPPAVPLPFRWRASSTAEVLGIWHPGGYPNNAGPSPSEPGGLSRRDCVVIKGFAHVLCYAFRTDNSGPPESVREVLQYYEILRAEFPGATLRAAAFEDYVQHLLRIRHRLPEVRAEMGDTWIVGVASDPRKMAEFRAVSRALHKCLSTHRCASDDIRVNTALFLLMKVPEHTWGLPSVNDNVNWTNAAFERNRFRNPHFVNCSRSWLEQRNVTYKAIEALGSHPVVADIKAEFGQLQPVKPSLKHFAKISDFTRKFVCGKGATLGFGRDGAITTFTTGRKQWADATHPLAQFRYKTYNESDFQAFSHIYDYNGASAGFYKHNASLYAKPESRFWDVRLLQLYQAADKSCSFQLQLQVQQPRAHSYYGAPAQLWAHVRASADGFHFDLQWFNKTATRLPEALFVDFRPRPQPNYVWRMSKLGAQVDPLGVMLNGSQAQHAVDQLGVTYFAAKEVKADDKSVLIRSLDAPLVCPYNASQSADVFPALSPLTGPVQGMAFNLYNNIWDTNYILWYPYLHDDASFKARFQFLLLDTPGQ